MRVKNTKMKDYMMPLMPINNKKIISKMMMKRKKNKKKRKRKVKNKKTVVHPKSKKNFLKKLNNQFHIHRKKMMILRINKVKIMIFLMEIVMLKIRKRVKIKILAQ